MDIRIHLYGYYNMIYGYYKMFVWILSFCLFVYTVGIDTKVDLYGYESILLCM